MAAAAPARRVPARAASAGTSRGRVCARQSRRVLHAKLLNSQNLNHNRLALLSLHVLYAEPLAWQLADNGCGLDEDHGHRTLLLLALDAELGAGQLADKSSALDWHN